MNLRKHHKRNVAKVTEALLLQANRVGGHIPFLAKHLDGQHNTLQANREEAILGGISQFTFDSCDSSETKLIEAEAANLRLTELSMLITPRTR